MNNRQTAVDMIESRLAALEAGNDSPRLHGEADMATEMAYIFGSISCSQYHGYVARRAKVVSRESEEFLERIRGAA
jgi:hypothetical protein